MVIAVTYLIAILFVLRQLGIRDIKYVGIAVMAILCTRPNIFGEYVGLINPIFWLGLMFLTKMRKLEKRSTTKFESKGIIPIFVAFIVYWLLSFSASQYNNIEFYYWPAIANLGTLAFILVSISYLASNGGLEKFLLIFAFLNSFLGLSGLISKYALRGFGCENLILGREWEYKICAPGTIFIGDRLTGIGGEPAIYASYCILSIAILLIAKINRSAKLIAIFGCIAGVILTSSSTGYAILPISVLLFMLFIKGSIFKKTFLSYFLLAFLLMFYSVLIKFANSFFITKKSSNILSVTDRGLNVPLSEYFESWGKGFFYDGSSFNNKYSAISVLRESLSQGIWVILLYLVILVFLSFLSHNSFVYLVTILPISVTVFIAEPFWSNAFWIALLLTSALYIKQNKSLAPT